MPLYVSYQFKTDMKPKPVDMRIGSIQVLHEVLIQDFDKRREIAIPCG